MMSIKLDPQHDATGQKTDSSSELKEHSIVIRHLNKKFKTRYRDIVVLENLNLSIRRGEFFVIVGPSGCGKTTLLRILAGLEREYDGYVMMSSRDTSRPLFQWYSKNSRFFLGAACGLRTGPSINEDAQSSSQNGRMEKGSSSTGTSIVKTGYVGSLSDAGIFIAIDNGYFEEQGIEVELQKFNTAGDAIPHLATGNLQVASGGVSPGLFNAVRQGIPIRIVADKGSLRRGQGFNVLVVRKDLFESGEIRRINDLKGKIVAIVEKSVAEYELYETLRQAGMSLSDVKVANVPYSEVPAALANKRVDAAITIEPFGTVAEEKGVGKILVTMDKESCRTCRMLRYTSLETLLRKIAIWL